VTEVLASECAGLWRRTLLVRADGSRDVGTDVRWLQGATAFVDSRGFAGRLHQDGDVFEWRRDVDLEPPGPYPDVGSMRWDGEVLVETGVHERYTERWVRDEHPKKPTWAVFLTAANRGGLLLRVGDRFGWADDACVVVGTVGEQMWCELDIERLDDELQANGVRWAIEDSEGVVNL
jgi:hypothetical protein